MAVLIYVIKLGPKSWYMPSAAKLRRQQRKELRSKRHAMRQQRELGR